MRPRDRTALINEAIEATLNRQKDQDHHWEDQIDVRHFINREISCMLISHTACYRTLISNPWYPTLLDSSNTFLSNFRPLSPTESPYSSDPNAPCVCGVAVAAGCWLIGGMLLLVR